MFRRIIFLFCGFVGALSIPDPQLTPCKRDDDVCLTKNSNIVYKLSVNGIPELNVENLDPMYHENIVGDLGAVKYHLRNTTMAGFVACDVVNTKLELEKSKLSLNMLCPHFNMKGLYEISGQLLTMPIEGNGDYELNFKDYFVTIDTDIKIVEGKDGKKYISFKSFKTTADLRGGMIADLKNLFNGNKELGEQVLKFINQNSKPVATLLQGPSFNANVRKLIKNFNKYLKTIPLDKMIQ